MSRRILFVIRTKLGDSLAAYQAARNYADAYPDDTVHLLIRRDYAQLLAGERGLRIIPFANRASMLARLLWLRCTQPAYAILAILRGFGDAMRQISPLVRARLKVYPDGRFPNHYPAYPQPYVNDCLVQVSWQAIRVFAPDFAKPLALAIPSLTRQRALTLRPGIVGVVALANELRRNFDAESLADLLLAVRARHPHARIRLILNPGDRGAADILGSPLPPDLEVAQFASLQEVALLIAELDAWYGTDTGLYHLAVAMGVPSTLLFGPTQPQTVIMAEQANVNWQRISALGDAHCDVTDCRRPVCLYQTAANFAGAGTRIQTQILLADTPDLCPLRASPPDTLYANRHHENPDYQA